MATRRGGEVIAEYERATDDPSTPVTITCLAEPAKASVPAGYKFIDSHSGMATDALTTVAALISQYGYRTLAPISRGSMRELALAELEHMWGVEIIRGVQRVAWRHGAGLVLTEFGPEHNTIRYWIDDSLAVRPAGVVMVAQLSGQQRNRLRARGIPFVVLDPFKELAADVCFVGATNWRGGRSAARHLIELGHRRIAMIRGPGHMFCQARLDGYRSALQGAGQPVPDDFVVPALLTQESGYTAALGLLNRLEPPTAIFASNDLQALGVYQAARALGLRIPADLSVVGFDDLPIATQTDPPLTTIHQPLTEMAMAATELALALRHGGTPPRIGIELATTLIVRRSTAEPRGRRKRVSLPDA